MRRIAMAGLWTLAACQLDEQQADGDSIATTSVVTLTLAYFDDFSPAAIQAAPFVAYRDGDAPWQVMPSVEGRYAAEIHGDRYGLAFGYQAPNASRVNVLYSTVAENRDTLMSGPTPAPRPYNLIVDFSGGLGLLVYGRTFVFPVLDEVVVVPARLPSNDLFAWREEPVALDTGVQGRRTTEVVRMAGVDARATPAVEVDFALPYPAPVGHPVTFEHGTATGIARTGIRNGAALDNQANLGTDNHLVFAMPASQVRADDLYSVSYTFDTAPGATGYAGFYETRFPDHLDLERGTPFTAPPAQLLAGPYPRPIATFAPVPGGLAFVDYSLQVNSSAVGYLVRASAGWVGDAGTATLAMPDFTGLAGWSPSLELPASGPRSWSITRTETNSRDRAAGGISHRAFVAGAFAN